MPLEKMRIVGGYPLEGEIIISGAKNATLPMLAATLLTPEPCQLTNVPRLKDVATMIEILQSLGVRVERKGDEVKAQAQELTGNEAPYDFVRKMRASVLLLGPLLARHGFARVALPGGCAIGVRPIDLHLKAMTALGAEIELKDGYVEAKAQKLVGTTHIFDSVTVTGTINAMFAASAAKGTTYLKNCAREPEIVAVAEGLQQMGAKISGAGTATIEIEGGRPLHGFTGAMIPDRIETGTYMVAAGMTRGKLFLKNARSQDLEAVIAKVRETGTEVVEDKHGLRVVGQSKIQAVHFQTAPHPGFPTDMQAQFVSLLSLAEGTSNVTETIFENRFMHIAELVRMGANLRISGATVTVSGVEKLRGAPVMATDLRASASLVLAGLVAEGETDVLRIYHLDRGYEKMDDKLRSVGAKISRLDAQ